ncbi:MAG TPA: NrfD/PsrC family molybdoenzyme membrane anchor subunit [bacterium]|jgi:molybdopterin-containing oxidoreductase family membrane subunit|nr:NrfD/PsrC family molybdoenzyme membrane anchor subunit [bacterium]
MNEAPLDAHLIGIVRRPPRWYPLAVMLLAAVAAWGVYAWTVQYRIGLGVTGLHNRVPWGFYIINFVFLIGISHAGTLVSAILRITGAEWRRPITRMAEVITVVALMTGAAMVVVDMGRPDRLLNVVRYGFGRLSSPIIWDVLSVSTYLMGSLIYLYIPLIPDLALLYQRLGPDAPRWQRWLYRVLAMGWQGTPRQRARLERVLAIMAVLIIPIAVSVHTVVSFVFSMTLRVGWHSSIFGPYFVVGAIFSGIAGIILAMAVFRRIYRLHAWITDDHFRKLGWLLLALNLIYLYFTFSEYLTIGYQPDEAEAVLLQLLFSGAYGRLFWLMVIGGLVTPALLIVLPSVPSLRRLAAVPVLRPVPVALAAASVAGSIFLFRLLGIPGPTAALPIWLNWEFLQWPLLGLAAVLVISLIPILQARPVTSLVIASILITVGMWLKRYLIVVPSLAVAQTPIEAIGYRPTWVEWSILAGTFAGFALLYLVFSRVFPIISLWEVREAHEAGTAEPSGGRDRPLRAAEAAP